MRALAAATATAGGVATLWACCGQCGLSQAPGKWGATLLPRPVSAARTGARKHGIGDNIATPPTSPERTESSSEERDGVVETATPALMLSDRYVDQLTEEDHGTVQHNRHEDSDTVDDAASPQTCRAPSSEAEETRVEWGADKERKQSQAAPEAISAQGGPLGRLGHASGPGSGSELSYQETKREGNDGTRSPAQRQVREDRVLESVGADPDDAAGNTVYGDLQTVVDKFMTAPTDQTKSGSHIPDHDQPAAVGVGESDDEEDQVPEAKGADNDGGGGPSGRRKDSALPRPPLGRVAATREIFESARFANADAASARSMCEPVMDEKTRRSVSLAISFTQLRDDITSIEADAAADYNDCQLPDKVQPDHLVDTSSDQKLSTVPEHEAMSLGVARDRCSSTCSSNSDGDYMECIDDGRPHGTPTVVPWHPIEEVPPARRGPDATAPFVHRPLTSAFKRVG